MYQADIKVIKNVNGVPTLIPIDLDTANEFIKAYVPEADTLMFVEAFGLAMICDERAATELMLSDEDVHGESATCVDITTINAHLETAKLLDAMEAM